MVRVAAIASPVGGIGPGGVSSPAVPLSPGISSFATFLTVSDSVWDGAPDLLVSLVFEWSTDALTWRPWCNFTTHGAARGARDGLPPHGEFTVPEGAAFFQCRITTSKRVRLGVDFEEL